MKKLIMSVMAAVMTLCAGAEEPKGYYDSCEGKTGNALLKALYEVVGPHTKVSYDGLWEVYKESDVRPDGTLWDMYSTKAWPTNFNKCGNYKLVGDCVNREHSFPKSWWGGASQEQYSDAYHLYPTDGKVNGQRSNFPYGECAGGTQLAANGSVKPLGRLGTSTFPGYTGKVFEPDDEYKGDFARSYFYMATAYNNKISGWSSDMLAGNNYPVFSSWAVNLLLKWSRQDPVSEKELNRNEAVSRFQKNRNPFIDHPELVEYIWGNKVGVAWYSGAAVDPAINVPADGSAIDMGLAAVGVPRSMGVTVKGTALDEDIRVSVNGNGFSVSPAVLGASAANGDGATLIVIFNSSAAGASTGTVTLTSGDVKSSFTVSCRAVDGLPVSEPYDITDTSFAFDWTCLDEDGGAPYVLDVTREGVSIEGYPRSVDPALEHAEVTDLEPETTYCYRLTSSSLSSDVKTVTTLAPVPSVEFLFDGDLDFSALPGEPSDVAEVLVVVDNIPGDVTVSVLDPFQVSLDKQTWGRSVVLVPGEERFYMRLMGNVEGDFTTPITATATDFFYDEVDATGHITEAAGEFFEDFEVVEGNNYNEKTYHGNACLWSTNCLFNNSDAQAYPHSGAQAARFNKSGTRHLTMLESKLNGIGKLSFWARLWSAETTTARFDVQISEDGGSKWESVGSIEVPSKMNAQGNANEYDLFTLTVERQGSLRIRLLQTEGGRVLLDDLTLSNYRRQDGVSIANEAEYHSWDAFCRQGLLVLESDGRSEDFAQVYSMDGTEQFAGLIGAGRQLNVAPGVYVVVVRDFSRRVVVR